MIADETVERVRAAADIVAIISEFVPLRRAGADYRGPCPFHGGKNPNFAVSQKRGSYHCFVCQESGDVFTFFRKHLGLDWPTTVKQIGERVGIEVVDTPRRAQAPDPNERNWETLSAASQWFRERLAADEGSAARAYLESRALDDAACARFEIGFAPRDPNALRRYLHTLGYDDARQLEAGLLVVREGESEPRVRFRGRIMFPILDESGHHVGFGGRALGDVTPKYLNSPESAVFHKGTTLYGMHTARNAMRRARRAIVVEGYVDAIRLALAGIEEVVAPLGTALTEGQAELLARHASEVFLMYDSDEAGQRATFRSGLELLRQRVAVRVVTLPPGPGDDAKQDPDSFVRAHGKSGMESQLSQAIDLFDRQIQLTERAGMFRDLRRIRRAVDRLLPTIRAAREPLARDMYLSRLAEASGLDKTTLAAEADEIPDTRRRRDGAPPAGAWEPGPPPADGPPPEPGPEDYEASPSIQFQPRFERPWKGRRRGPQVPEWQSTLAPPRVRRDEPVERQLVRAMLIERHLAEQIAERHGPDDFRDPEYRALFAALLACAPDDDLEQVAERLDPDALARLRELSNGLDSADPAAADVSISLARLDARPVEARRDEILVALRSANPEEYDTLMRERLDLEKELRRLLPIRSPQRKPKG